MVTGGFYTGRLRSEVQPLPFDIPFLTKKGTPFVYPLLKNGAPFTYLVYSFAFLLTAVNALSLKYEQITKPERFLDLFTTIECIFQLFWVFLQTAMTDFPILSYTLISEIPTLSCTWSLKKIPFSGGAPLKGHFKDYPSPVFVMVFGVHRFAGSVCNGVTNRNSYYRKWTHRVVACCKLRKIRAALRKQK